MRKSFSKIVIFTLIISTLLLQACSLKLTKKDLYSIETIKVVRYKTPDLQVKTLTGVVINLVGGGAIVPTVVASTIDKNKGKKATKDTIMPDYGELLVKDFMEIVKAEIPGWPIMTAINNPVEKGYKYKDGAFILFDIHTMWLTIVGGLTIDGDMVMTNSNGDKIFKKHFFYRSRDFNLKKSQREYVANNCEQLITEVPLAAEHTARDLIINDLKESL